MNNPGTKDYELITRSLRGKLSAAEERELKRRLEAEGALRDAYEAESSMDQLLDRLPNVPLSTNFTALVLESVRLEERSTERTVAAGNAKVPWFRWRFARLITGLAVVTFAGVISVQQYRRSEQAELARNVASFTQVASMMSPQEKPALVFRDFQTIERLSLPGETELDLELLVALQK